MEVEWNLMCRTFDIMWREAVMELLDQLEAENPDDSVLAPKVLSLQRALSLNGSD